MSMDIIIAFIAVIISFFSVLIGSLSFYHNRLHNIKSVKPFCDIVVGDYEDKQWVKIQNNGVGPLIIKSIKIENENGVVTSDLIDWMPDEIDWKTYKKNLENRAIFPNNELTLLKYETDLGNQDSIIIRDNIRRILKTLTIYVEYTDVYDSEFKPSIRFLDFFGRHFQN